MTERQITKRRIHVEHNVERLNIELERRKLDVKKLLYDILNKFIVIKHLLIEGQQGLHVPDHDGG
jgi:hypothetical protein